MQPKTDDATRSLHFPRYDDILSVSLPDHEFYKAEHAAKSQGTLCDEWKPSSKGFKSAFKAFANMVDQKFACGDFQRDDAAYRALHAALSESGVSLDKGDAPAFFHVRNNPDNADKILIGARDSGGNPLPLLDAASVALFEDAELEKGRVPGDILRRIAMPIFKLHGTQLEKLENDIRILSVGIDKTQKLRQLASGKAFLRNHLAIVEDPTTQTKIIASDLKRKRDHHDIEEITHNAVPSASPSELSRKKIKLNLFGNNPHHNANTFKVHPPNSKLRTFLTFLSQEYPNPPFHDLRTITSRDIAAFDKYLNQTPKPLGGVTKQNYASSIRAYITKHFPQSEAAKIVMNDPTLSAWNVLGNVARSVKANPLKVRSRRSKTSMKPGMQGLRGHGMLTSSADIIDDSTFLSDAMSKLRKANTDIMLAADALQSGHPSEVLEDQESAASSNRRKGHSADPKERTSASLSNARDLTKRKRDEHEIGEKPIARTASESAKAITQHPAATLYNPTASTEFTKNSKKTRSIRRKKTTARAFARKRAPIRSRNGNIIVRDSHPNAQTFKESPPNDKVRPFLAFLDQLYPNPPYYNLRTISSADISAYNEHVNKRAKPLNDRTKSDYASGIRAYITSHFPYSDAATMLANNSTLNAWNAALVNARRERATKKALINRPQKIRSMRRASSTKRDDRSTRARDLLKTRNVSRALSNTTTQNRVNAKAKVSRTAFPRYDDILSVSKPQHEYYKPEHAGKSQGALHDEWAPSNSTYKSVFRHFATMVDQNFGCADVDKDDGDFLPTREKLLMDGSILTNEFAVATIHVRRNPDFAGRVSIGARDAEGNLVSFLNTTNGSYSDEATLDENRLPIGITRRLAMPVFRITLAQHQKMKAEAGSLKEVADKTRRKGELSAGKAFLRDHLAIIENPGLESTMKSAVVLRMIRDHDIEPVEGADIQNRSASQIEKKIARKYNLLGDNHPNAASFRDNPPSASLCTFLNFLAQRSPYYDLRELTAADITAFEQHLNEKPEPPKDSTKLSYAYEIRKYITTVSPRSDAATMIQNNETFNAWIETGRNAMHWNKHHALVDDYINWDRPGIDPSPPPGSDGLMSLDRGASRKRKRTQDVLVRPQKKAAAGRKNATKRGKAATRNQDPLDPYDAAEKNTSAIEPADFIENRSVSFDNIEQLRADANLNGIHPDSSSMTTLYGDEIGPSPDFGGSSNEMGYNNLQLSEGQSTEMSLLHGIFLLSSRDDSPPIAIDPALLAYDREHNAKSPGSGQQAVGLRRTRHNSPKSSSPMIAGLEHPRDFEGHKNYKHRT